MKFIIHRCNRISDFKHIPVNYGVEIDIRSRGNSLIVGHDPFVHAEFLEDWLQYYSHNQLILNVKEEGLEENILKLMKKYNINNYFFLDLSVPSLVRNAKSGHKKSAVRFSEYEPIETAIFFSGLLEWIWVDSFNSSYDHLHKLKGLNSYKFCLVSPELHGRTKKEEIMSLASKIKELGLNFDAICTKDPLVWIDSDFV
jgi:hypothetical protein